MCVCAWVVSPLLFPTVPYLFLQIIFGNVNQAITLYQTAVKFVHLFRINVACVVNIKRTVVVLKESLFDTKSDRKDNLLTH